MTNNGNIVSVNRFGMNKIDNDPLSKASFETSIDVLSKAA